jgi:putative protein kinase ArgK-like GTPase of G3E family
MRSLATREFGSEISAALPDVIAAAKCAGFDLIVVETSGIGQGDAAIVPHVDVPLYVMTPEFGAASQLEKIDMLDFAEFVAINKFDRKGAADALRDVAKQVQRNKEAWGTPTEQMPVFGTMAAHFNDDGVTALYQAMKPRLQALGLPLKDSLLPAVAVRHSSHQTPIVPGARSRYLAEISDSVRGYKRRARDQAQLAREIQQLEAAALMLAEGKQGRAKAKRTIDQWQNNAKACQAQGHAATFPQTAYGDKAHVQQEQAQNPRKPCCENGSDCGIFVFTDHKTNKKCPEKKHDGAIEEYFAPNMSAGRAAFLLQAILREQQAC